jgi:hypothetical protein
MDSLRFDLRAIPYREAIRQHFGWKPSEYLIKSQITNSLIFCREGTVYEVASFADIQEVATTVFTDAVFAEAMFQPRWTLDILEDAHERPLFWVAFTKEVYREHDTAFSLAKTAKERAAVQARCDKDIAIAERAYRMDGKRGQSFWTRLYNTDDASISIFGCAVVASAAVFDKDVLIDELTAMMIDEGKDVFNELNDGTWVCVDLNPANDKDCNDTYYIFSVAQEPWESALDHNESTEYMTVLAASRLKMKPSELRQLAETAPAAAGYIACVGEEVKVKRRVSRQTKINSLTANQNHV